MASSATSSSLHLKSRREDTHIFSAGFFSFKPLKQPDLCSQKPSIQNSKKLTPEKSLFPNRDKPSSLLPPIQDPSIPNLPPLSSPNLPELPKLPPLPPLPPLQPLPGIPFQPLPTHTPKKDSTHQSNAHKLAPSRVTGQRLFFTSARTFGFPFAPNPFRPPSIFPPNPFQPPPSILPPNPFQPPPSIIPPILPSPPPSIISPILPIPPILPFPPIPGFTPPSPPPPAFPIPLPPFPFQPIPGFPGNPPPASKKTAP